MVFSKFRIDQFPPARDSCVHCRGRLLPLLLGMLVFLSGCPVFPQSEPVGRLIFQIPEAGYSIFLDGRPVGNTPLKSDTLRLSVGAHTVSVTEYRSRSWLQAALEFPVVLTADSLVELDIEVPARVWIESNPSHAEVTFHNELIGRTPLPVKREEWRTSLLSIRKKGFKSYSLRQPPVSQDHIRIHLIPEETVSIVSSGPEAASIFKSRSVLLTGALALGGGIAGYVFKTLAEKSYDRYQSAGQPADMDRYFDRAVMYDQISGICYVTCEINFCAALFFSIRKAAN